MKKAVITIVALMLLVSATGVFAEAQQEAASDKVKLTMFHYLDRTETTAGNFDVMLAEFDKLYPNIELTIDYLTGEPYHNKLQAMAVADQLPDVVFLWPDMRTGDVTGSGKIKDLRPWLKGHEKEFAAMAMGSQGRNGEIYELPEQVTVTHVMFTNTKLMKDLGLTFPKTHAELLAQGAKINGAGLIPISMANKDGWEMQSCLASTLTERAGGVAWYDKAIAGNGASFADPEFVNGLKVIKDLSDGKMFSPGINQAEYSQGVNDYIGGKAVYWIDGGWMTNNLVKEQTPEEKANTIFKAYPDIPNQKGKSGSTAAVAGTGHGMNVKLTGAKAEAAWNWIWFYSGPVGSKIRQGFGANPAYILPVPADLDIQVKKLIEFVNTSPMGYVLDSKIPAEPIGVFNTGLQEMMMGAITPEALAAKFEAAVRK